MSHNIRRLAAVLILASLPPAGTSAGDDARDLATVLRRWHRAYVAGKLELRGVAREDGTTDKLYGRGLLPRYSPARLTHVEALELLLERSSELQTPEVARRLVVLASVGLDGERYDFDMAPYTVRRMCLGALAQIDSTDALHAILLTARGDRDGWRSGDFGPAVQSSALRALGATGRSVFRPAIDAQLGHADPIVRLGAAEGELALANARSVDAVRIQLNAETDPTIAQVLVEAARRALERDPAKNDAATTRRLLATAIDRLGETDWRTDYAIVELLSKFRGTMAIEPLIAMLERFVSRPDLVDEGKLSGLLRHKTHELLQSLTGARIAIDRPDLWREFWEREKDTFRLAPRNDADDSHTASAFFGIPVTGSRVMFLIDTSGSMNVPHRPFDGPTSSRSPEPASRLAWAKRELLRAVDALPPDAQFNVIAFSGEVSRWRSQTVPASASARSSLRTQLAKLRADGATNIFGALQRALELKSVSHGTRYAAAVDEIFLLSDGQPTAGDVILADDILDVITETNRFSRVRINTVYMGGVDSAFMKRLAENSGGRYVRL